MNNKTASEDIEENVIRIVGDQLNLDALEIDSSSSIVDDLGADSLDCVELVMAFEQEYDIEISDEEAMEADTIEKVVALIESMTGEEPVLEENLEEGE